MLKYTAPKLRYKRRAALQGPASKRNKNQSGHPYSTPSHHSDTSCHEYTTPQKNQEARRSTSLKAVRRRRAPTNIDKYNKAEQAARERGKKKKRYLDNSESQRKRERKRVWRVTIMAMLYVLLGKHILHLLVGEVDLVYGISSILQRDVVAVDVGGEKDF
jgi:hypothetical protein